MPRRDSYTKFYEGNGNKRKRGLTRGKKLKRRKWLKRKEERDRLERMYNPAHKPRQTAFNPKKGRGNTNHTTKREGHQASGRYNNRRRDESEHSRAS